MIKIDFERVKRPLIIFLILIVLSLTLPFLLPATFGGAYLFWLVLTILVILYGLLLIGGLK